MTILLGWNIYTIFDFRQERQNLKAYFDEQKQSVKAVGSDLNIRQLYYPIGSVKSYSLFQSALSEMYAEVVYRHRNRCAHNTLSYQVNKPDFSVLASTDFFYQSYFFRFAVIVLIDEIFMVLFRKYVSLQN